MKGFILISIFIFQFIFPANSQENNSVHWEFESNKLGEKTYELKITAYINGTCKLYGMRNDPNIGKPLSFHFSDPDNFKSMTNIVSDPDPETEFDEVLMVQTEYYKGKVEFMKLIELIRDEDIHLTVRGQLIDSYNSKAIIINEEHTFKFKNKNDE